MKAFMVFVELLLLILTLREGYLIAEDALFIRWIKRQPIAPVINPEDLKE